MPKRVYNDITGKKFGRLTALRFIPDNSQFSKFVCLCDCGVEKIILAQSLIRGATVSCGCYSRERSALATKHGHAGKNRSLAYKSWASMMDRCEWGGHPVMYARYGMKGIKVSDEWKTFTNFLRDMGERPKDTSIDRIDNNLGYFNGNCRWATRKEQSLNRSNTVKAIYEGRVVCVYALCEEKGISIKALRARAHRRNGNYIEALASMGVNATAFAV